MSMLLKYLFCQQRDFFRSEIIHWLLYLMKKMSVVPSSGIFDVTTIVIYIIFLDELD